MVELKENDVVYYSFEGSDEVRCSIVEMIGKGFVVIGHQFCFPEGNNYHTEDRTRLIFREVFRRNGTLFNRVWHDAELVK